MRTCEICHLEKSDEHFVNYHEVTPWCSVCIQADLVKPGEWLAWAVDNLAAMGYSAGELAVLIATKDASVLGEPKYPERRTYQIGASQEGK